MNSLAVFRNICVSITALSLLVASPVVFSHSATNPSNICTDLPRAQDPAALGWDDSGFPVLRQISSQAGAAAVLIVTDGQVVFADGLIDRPMFLASVRKSILSALMGIAIEQGALNLNDTMARWHIDDNVPLTDTELQASVRDLISARSGVYLPSAAESSRMSESRPERGAHPPGTFWFYNNWDFNAAGAVFERATQKSIFLAFEHYIAQPLCMQDFHPYENTWYVYGKTFPRFPAYHMALSARDLARFGLLYLQKGLWRGNRILPEGWVADSTRAVSRTNEEPELASGYGYMWWVTLTNPPGPQAKYFEGSYTAIGSGGQRMTILPVINTVILARADTKPGGVGQSEFKDTKVWQSFVQAALKLYQHN